MSATVISMVRPRAGGITTLPRMMTPPTRTMVSVWPTPHRTPMTMPPRSVCCRVTIVLTAITWSGSVAWRIPRKKPRAMSESTVVMAPSSVERGDGAPRVDGEREADGDDERRRRQLQPADPASAQPGQNSGAHARGDHADDHQHRGEPDAEDDDREQAEQQLAAGERGEQDRERARVGQEPARDPEPGVASTPTRMMPLVWESVTKMPSTSASTGRPRAPTMYAAEIVLP